MPAPDVPQANWTAAGVYVPSFVPAAGGAELSVMIRRSKVCRDHDRELSDRLAEAYMGAFKGLGPDLVVSIPERPGEEDRLRFIRADLAGRIGAADLGSALRHTRLVDGYRQLTTPQRLASCPGQFIADDHVRGRSVLLIDDVITSGAEASEALRALRAAGADLVHFAAVAIASAAPEDAREPSCPRKLDSSHSSHTMAS